MQHYEPGYPKPEIVIGLAGPIGTDLRGAAAKLESDLRSYEYRTEHIRVSELIKQMCEPALVEQINGLSEERRIDTLMNAGDTLRCRIKNGAAIVPAIVLEIRRKRQNFFLKEGCEEEFERSEIYNRCYIINSLKHPDEVDVLRKIYKEKFVLISVVGSQETRRKNLSAQISKSYSSTDDARYKKFADILIEKDRQRTDSSIGQNISDTFPLADFFVRTSEYLAEDIGRCLRILFGDQRETPTRLEFAMYEARSNAYRSADLSRQVGAVIATNKMEIIARGCNEVPIPGGDIFWSDDKGIIEDNRDIGVGRDFNSVKKVEILNELLEFLKAQGIAQFGNKNLDETVNQLVFEEYRSDFKHLRVSNLIEFGRMIHAEMSALMEAARRGFAVGGGVLVCTTFPCHMCARHIISAGIRQVYYIEPYPKSMTAEIYRDEIEIDSGAPSIWDPEIRPQKVYFRSFFGVAPRFFAQAFQMRPRKDQKGYALEFDEGKALPSTVPLSRSHLSDELIVGQSLSLIDKLNDFDEIRSQIFEGVEA